MQSLVVEFVDISPYSDSGPCTLTLGPEFKDHDLPRMSIKNEVAVKLGESPSRTHDDPTNRITSRIIYHESIGETRYIFKVGIEAYGIALLEEEAKLYCNDFKTLQGSAVLHFFGVYRGQVYNVSDDEVGNMVCLVLQGFKRQPGHLSDLTNSEKEQILQCIGKIHKAGWTPSDTITNQDIVTLHDDSFRYYFDFDEIEKHDCHWIGEFFVGQQIHYLGCTWLVSLCKDMNVWIKYKYTRILDGVSYEVQEDCPKQEIIDALTPSDFVASYDNSAVLLEAITKHARKYLEEKQGRSLDDTEFKDGFKLPIFPHKSWQEHCDTQFDKILEREARWARARAAEEEI